MPKQNAFEQFADNLHSEDLRSYYELEAMRYGFMARLGLEETDALELAVRIVALAGGDTGRMNSPQLIHNT